jgi:hypothetical protein
MPGGLKLPPVKFKDEIGYFFVPAWGCRDYQIFGSRGTLAPALQVCPGCSKIALPAPVWTNGPLVA